MVEIAIIKEHHKWMLFRNNDGVLSPMGEILPIVEISGRALPEHGRARKTQRVRKNSLKKFVFSDA